MPNILEDTIREVSNRYSIKEAVNIVSKVDYHTLAQLNDTGSNIEIVKKELELPDDSIEWDVDYSTPHLLNPELYNPKSTYSTSLEGNDYFNNASSTADEDNLKQFSDTASETMSTQEAEETMEDIHLAYLSNSRTDVDYITRRKFSNWIMFNPGYFKLFEAQALTRDVNYTEF